MKRFIFFLLNLHPIYVKKNKCKTNFTKKLDIKINIKDKSYRYLKIVLRETIKDYNFYFQNIINFQSEIKKFFNKKNFSLIISNITKGLEGGYADEAAKKKIPSICVSHGTIAKHFNKFDKIYKKTIAEAVFSGKFQFFAIQSKIMQKSLMTHNLKGKALQTGNLIFAEKSFNFFASKKKFILYAVTLKDLFNFQVYGVELFYEFLMNLENLDKIAKDKGYQILVNIHPGQAHLKKDLSSIYKNLNFKTEKIEKLIENSFVMISFSSTAIEDALNSKVPVILLDNWKRYKHCEIVKKSKFKTCLFYVNNYSDLVNNIDYLSKEKNNIKKKDFYNYIFPSKSSKNLKKIINQIIQ